MRQRFLRLAAVCAIATLTFVRTGALTNGGSITALETPLTETFDSLISASSTTWVNDSTIPGWYTARSGTGSTIVADTGGSNAGNLYSYGASGNTDRALGSVGSGNAAAGNFFWGVRLANNSGASITSLTVSYVGEQWRNSAAAAQTVSFSYRIGQNLGNALTDFTTGGTAVPQLDFTSPITGGTAGALNGNLAANRVAISFTITGLSLASGDQILLRWSDPDHTGSDHGLSIDDFSVTAHGTAVTDNPPSVSATSPTNGATGVPLTSQIMVTFSERVTATASAFSVECPAGAPQAVTQSPAAGTPATTMTLTPSAALPAGTICTLKVLANQIADVDGTPDNMAADRVITFTTLADAAPGIIATSPSANATGVAIDTSIVVNFSESVSADASAFTLECPAGFPETLGVSSSPAASFTLTPTSHLPYATKCTVKVSAAAVSDTDTNDPPDHMAADVSFPFTTALPPAAGKVVINEIDADTPGSPQDTAEFVELFDGGVGNTPLDGLVVVFYDGTPHTSYAAFDLTGKTTSASGYFTIGNPAVANVDLTFPVGEFGFLQNGPDAVALFAGSVNSFPNGTGLTTANLQDAIVYGTDDAQDGTLKTLLNAGQLQVNEAATGDGPDLSLQRCANGSGGARNTATYYPGTPSPGATNACPPARQPSSVVISQVYGGGGNSGAQFHNDFVELFNRGAASVDLSGWSLQYTSSTGNTWDSNLQPIGGRIGGGERYLIALGAGAGGGAPLPDANIVGSINMSATSGKVALVNRFDALVGGCPIYDAHVVDLVGYGAADCGEAMRPASALSNTTSLLRKGDGGIDTDNNAADFDISNTPDPTRRTAPIVEIGPFVLRTDPNHDTTDAPRDATIGVTFTEAVDVDPNWFDITCSITGNHNDATFAGGGQSHFITPNVSFLAGESCTVTVKKDFIHDQDTDDSAPNTDTLPENKVWTFTVATGTPPPYPPSVHLTMGNPSHAVADVSQPLNYLMEKPEYALSYNRDLGRPNWVSWHLSDEWIGTLVRADTFRPDPEVPPDWYRVQAFDFSGSGFDRGHMTPNADRDKETSIPINQATFLMSNMVAQAPGNNQGPWAAFEAFLRTFVDTGNELYIVAGPAGTGGFNGTLDANKNPIETDTLANGHVTVPAATWKIALVLPKNSGDDVSRVSCTTRTISVIMPNDDAIRPDDWHTYIASINEVEALSGYDLLSNVPKPYQACIQVAKDGKVPNDPLTPGTQTITFTQPSGKTYGDAPFTAEATGGESGNPVTFAAAGACSSSGTDGATITITGAGTCTITASQAGFTAANGEIVYPPADLVTRMVPVGRAAPSLSALSSPSIGLGTAATTLSGHIANGILVPTGTVAITLNGVTQAAAIQANGDFSSTFATGSLAVINGGYGITYVYAGDANFTGVSGTGTLTIGYSVALLFDNTRAAKAGSTLPIKLVLTDTAGRDVSSPSVTVTAARLEQVSIAATSQVQDSGNANPDGNFRFDASLGAAGGYIFNLTTKGLATGTYSLVFTIAGDAGPHAVSFQVR